MKKEVLLLIEMHNKALDFSKVWDIINLNNSQRVEEAMDLRDYLFRIIVIFFSMSMLTACKNTSSDISNKDIISYAIVDIDADGRDELVAVNNGGNKEKLPTGEDCGKFIEIYKDFSTDKEKITVGDTPDYSFDFSNIKPSKIQLGDVNGDGKVDINIVVYKTVKFHKVLAKRPFFYDFESEKLQPLWLGSRLSRPFDDFILADINNDNISELISIESLQDGSKTLAVYRWEGFGFFIVSECDNSFKEIKFSDNKKGIFVIADGSEKELSFLSDKPIVK